MVFVVGLQGALECAARIKAVEVKLRQHLHEVPGSYLTVLADGLHELHDELAAVENAGRNSEETVDIAKMLKSITEIIIHFGMFSIHADKELKSLNVWKLEMEKAQKVQGIWKLEMEKAQKVQGIYTEIGEWVSVCFEEIGPEKIMRHLPAEFRKHKPLHWHCTA